MNMKKLYFDSSNNANSIVYDLDNKNELESLDYGMLSNNDISGLIKLSTSNFNGHYQLRYDVSRYTRLTSIIENKISWSLITKLLCNIIDVLLNTEEYLLSPNKVILNPEFVYFNKDLSEVKLIYVPFKDVSLEVSDIYQLSKYILSNSIIEEDMDLSVNKVLSYINSPLEKTFYDFRKLLSGETNISSLQAVKTPVSYKKNENSINSDSKIKASIFNKGKTKAVLIRQKNNEHILINKEQFLIGNNPQKCHYSCLSNEAISRFHASIIKHKNDYFIEDNNSTNKTYLNGKAITPKKQYKLKHNDKIKFANEAFSFEIQE